MSGPRRGREVVLEGGVRRMEEDKGACAEKMQSTWRLEERGMG